LKVDVGSSTISGTLQDLFDEDIGILIEEIEKEIRMRKIQNEN